MVSSTISIKQNNNTNIMGLKVSKPLCLLKISEANGIEKFQKIALLLAVERPNKFNLL